MKILSKEQIRVKRYDIILQAEGIIRRVGSIDVSRITRLGASFRAFELS
jgi:hypothetical protein